MLVFLCVVLGLTVLGHSLPQFEVYWESEYSYDFPGDIDSPTWYIDLENIKAGLPGNLAGPGIVTIGFADSCVGGCQEEYPDEFCSKYPPEGVPSKPRRNDDWGTKFNITSSMMTKGIAALKAEGAKVHLSYSGLYPTRGGGLEAAGQDYTHAEVLAQRMVRNVEEWGLDGVDIYIRGTIEGNFESTYLGNVGFQHYVLKNLRQLLPPEKTISYTILHQPSSGRWYPMEEVISIAHRYVDVINVIYNAGYGDTVLDKLTNELGVPAHKIGWLMTMDSYGHTEEDMLNMVSSIKQKGLRGLSVLSANQENSQFGGDYLKHIAVRLYD